MHTFEFDGKSLSDLGAVIVQRPTLYTPKKDLEFVKLPGKSGDIILDNQRYDNVNFTLPIRSIPAFCKYGSKEFAYKLSDWLITDGYKVYRDSYNPGYYRKAVVTEISKTVCKFYDVFETNITFNCYPFLFSDRGEITVEKSSSGGSVNFVLINSEFIDSAPIIQIVPLSSSIEVTVTIGQSTVITDEIASAITIDSEEKAIYYTATKNPCNDVVSCLYLPKLTPGENQLVVSGRNNDSFMVKVVPKWRRR